MVKILASRLFAFFLLLCLATTVIGCGSKVDGKYQGEGGLFTADFESGKVTMTNPMGPQVTADYTVDGDTITIKSKDGSGNLTMTINKDGTLQGPNGMGVLKKAAN